MTVSSPLEAVYPIVFIDATHYYVRENGIMKKLAAYVILAINLNGRKEVLNIEIGENESAKYWLGVLHALKNRGLKDILNLFYCYRIDRISALHPFIKSEIP